MFDNAAIAGTTLARCKGILTADQSVIDRVFPARGLSVGLIMPLETHPHEAGPTMRGHAVMAQHAEQLGFAALWLRDIPFYDPAYGDVGQLFEPMAYRRRTLLPEPQNGTCLAATICQPRRGQG